MRQAFTTTLFRFTLTAVALCVCSTNSNNIHAETPKQPAFKNSIGMAFSVIPAGEFLMGSPETERAKSNDEDQHRVRISKPFGMGQHEVTQAQFELIMESNPSFFRSKGLGNHFIKGQETANFPVDYVRWDEAVEFCKRLSDLPAEKEAGREYRLPTEAEWEYACRAGSNTPFSYGELLPSTAANFNGVVSKTLTTDPRNNRRQTVVVGSFAPNAWNLYDMHGNVFEWCQDYYDVNYYKENPKPGSPIIDPAGPTQRSIMRVTRGGAWGYHAFHCRSAFRGCFVPQLRDEHIGFRVVCELSP